MLERARFTGARTGRLNHGLQAGLDVPSQRALSVAVIE
jgi:hypothetical protein